MRLSSKGKLRWYAACCRTPVGNTLTSRYVPFTGLLAQCLDIALLAAAFGPVRGSVNTVGPSSNPSRGPTAWPSRCCASWGWWQAAACGGATKTHRFSPPPARRPTLRPRLAVPHGAADRVQRHQRTAHREPGVATGLFLLEQGADAGGLMRNTAGLSQLPRGSHQRAGGAGPAHFRRTRQDLGRHAAPGSGLCGVLRPQARAASMSLASFSGASCGA